VVFDCKNENVIVSFKHVEEHAWYEICNTKTNKKIHSRPFQTTNPSAKPPVSV
jgi:hypothetical protein